MAGDRKAAQQQEPIVHGLTADGYAGWKLHPATKVFCRYLKDFAAALERDHLERWRQSQTDPDHEAEARGRVNALREMATLEFRHMLDFYTPEPMEGATGAIDEKETE